MQTDNKKSPWVGESEHPTGWLLKYK